MQLLGIAFILYLLKLSAGNGFWKNIRNADVQAYKVAVTFKRLNKKLLSGELALLFLCRCRDEDVHPKFTRWKNLNNNIIDRDDNWNLLLYKEAYHIKRLTPFLNNGLKASRELRLFS